MILPYKTYETLTAGELRNKLKGVSNDTPIYLVLDKSHNNYDYDGNLRVVHPIESVQREWMVDCQGLEEESERNLILYLADEIYETYVCKLIEKVK